MKGTPLISSFKASVVLRLSYFFSVHTHIELFFSIPIDLEDWLLVPSGTNPGSPVGGKNTRKTSTSTNGEKISTNPLDEWEKQSLTYNWIVNDNNTSHGALFD